MAKSDDKLDVAIVLVNEGYLPLSFCHDLAFLDDRVTAQKNGFRPALHLFPLLGRIPQVSGHAAAFCTKNDHSTPKNRIF